MGFLPSAGRYILQLALEVPWWHFKVGWSEENTNHCLKSSNRLGSKSCCATGRDRGLQIPMKAHPTAEVVWSMLMGMREPCCQFWSPEPSSDHGSADMQGKKEQRTGGHEAGDGQVQRSVKGSELNSVIHTALSASWHSLS